MWAVKTYDLQVYKNGGVKRKGVIKVNTIKAKCAYCGYEEEYQLSPEESATLCKYEYYGRRMGKRQEVFPNILGG